MNYGKNHVSNNSSKNKHLLIGVIALIVFGVIAVLLVTSRNKPSEEEAVSVIKTEFKQLLGYEAETTNPLIREIQNGFDVKVHSISKKKNEYIVSCTFSNYDISQAFANLESNDEMSLKEFSEMFVNELKQQAKVNCDTELILVSSEDGYITSFTEEQLDSATGGLISYYKSISEEGNK